MLTLKEVEAEVRRLAAVIGASERNLPTFGYSDDWATPHIEVDGTSYHYVVRERGKELSHVTTCSLDELLYCAFVDITSPMASEYEKVNRVVGQDGRRLMFVKQQELLAVLSPEWARREKDAHQQILRRFPYDDASSARVERTLALRAQGLSPEAAWDKACEEFSLPEGS